jgi:hypothetical protein
MNSRLGRHGERESMDITFRIKLPVQFAAK